MILRIIKILLIILFFLKCSPHCCFSDETWRDETFGVTDEVFYSIAENPERKVTYLGTSGGLYKKSYNESAWNQIFACRGQYRGINHIFVDTGGDIYIATKNGLYRSKDSGVNWRRIFQGIDGENDCMHVIGDRENQKVFYLSTGKGLFWTIDGGRTWKKAFGELGKSKVNATGITKTGRAKKIFVIADNKVYRTDDFFGNYERVFSFNYSEETNTDEEDLEAEDSEDSGFMVKNLSVKENIIYLATNQGIFISNDDGVSWPEFNNAGLTGRNVNDIALSKDGTLFAATERGVFKYIKDRQSWIDVYCGMNDQNARRLLFTISGRLWAVCKRHVYACEAESVFFGRSKSLKAREFMSQFKNEPTINEVIKMAIDYAEVYPEKIKKWRKGAKFRALLPKVNFGIDHGESDTYEIYTATANSYWVYGPRDNSDGWDLNFSWDLSDLIWNPEQTSIDVRSKLMVQLRDDILNEVTRAYFERRRLQIEELLNPSDDLSFLLKKRLRIEELTATIDGLTGGCFSAAIEEE